MFSLVACGEPKPEHTHNYATLKYDNEYHWFECECEEKSNITLHNIKNSECACGYIVPHSHEYTTLKTDETHHWHECVCSDKSGNEAHKGGTASCTKLAVCSVCNESYGEFVEHNHVALENNETQHWDECVCGDKKNIQNHIPGAEATETTDQKCTVCDYVIVPALGHVHTLHLTKVDANAKSCTKEGNIEYYTCNCGKWFTDNTATTEITDKASVVIGKDTHDWEAGYSNDNKHHWQTCSVCLNISDKVPHSINEERICTSCFHQVFSEGLSLKSNGNSYTVMGIGTCTDTDIIIPITYNGKPVTSIGEYAFLGCSNLTSIAIPNSITSIGMSAFSACDGLISITIPDSITSINYGMFGGCSNLTNIIISDNVTSIGASAFYNCTSLISIKIPDSITSINYGMFEGCNNLANITMPDSVTNIDSYAFSGCSSLANITIPDSVTNIDSYAFSGCTNLASIVIPDSVTSIGWRAFENCNNLTSITIPFVGAAKDGTGTHFGYIFGASMSYEHNLYVPTSLKNVIITCGTSIGNGAFRYCTSLTSITIPDSVTNIGASAFYECTGLTSIIIPDSVTNIGAEAFKSCHSLTSVTIGNSVTSIGNGAFRYCTSLTSIIIPNSVWSIGSYAFYDCSNLTSVTIPDSVENIAEYAFSGETHPTIYCEAERKPSDWDKNWNFSNCPVVWGYSGGLNSASS